MSNYLKKEIEAKVIALAKLAKLLLTNWEPHETQCEVLHALFVENIKFIFIECGRKWGKTELICFIFWAWCLSKSKQLCYYVAPDQRQARELVWASYRLQTFGPADYIQDINTTYMRITFTNGSFVRVVGSERFNSLRGVNPHLIVYDEFKDHNPLFHEAMEPNLAAHQAPLIILGTPPQEDDNLFVTLGDFAKTHDYQVKS